MQRRFGNQVFRRLYLRAPRLFELAKTPDKLIWKLRLRQLKGAGRKRIALASYPRSGNTWMRALIEAATGQQTGSIYEDRIMTRKDEGIAIKTHGRDAYRYTHAVYIVRNPFDSIISQFHNKTQVHGKAGRWTWDEFVKIFAPRWADHARYWLNADVPKLQIRYEDLHADTQEVLTRILHWMGYDINEENIHKALETTRIENLRKSNTELGSKFFRQGKVGKGIEAFTNEQRRYVVNEVADVLEPLGYGDLLKYRQSSPATQSPVSAT